MKFGMSKRFSTLLAIASAVGATGAHAASATFDISWTDYYGNPQTADFTVFLAPISASPGEYDAVSATGTYEGQAVTGVTSVYRFPDNTFYAPVTGLTEVDYQGIDISFGGNDANFAYSGGYMISDNSSSFYQTSLGSSSITFDGAPEPAGWALMLVGFGGVGAASRFARKPVDRIPVDAWPVDAWPVEVWDLINAPDTMVQRGDERTVAMHEPRPGGRQGFGWKRPDDFARLVDARSKGLDLFLQSEFLSFQLGDPDGVGGGAARLCVDGAVERLMLHTQLAETGLDSHVRVTPSREPWTGDLNTRTADMSDHEWVLWSAGAPPDAPTPWRTRK
jgi:hypothetical protein